MSEPALKQQVHDFWNSESCGESYALVEAGQLDLSEQERHRYLLEPYIAQFARFADGEGRDVLEVGVGMGADHLLWARACPNRLAGVDLTQRAVEFTHTRLQAACLHSEVRVADAERLPFADDSFDIVYSWGVMHHSPDTAACFREARRVLRKGGEARIMVYHTWSLVGLMLWLRYGLAKGSPGRSMANIYSEHLESPGTKAYSRKEATLMLSAAGFREIEARVQLSHGDLLEGNVGARHQGVFLALAKRLWPRPLLRAFGRGFGLYLLLVARK